MRIEFLTPEAMLLNYQIGGILLSLPTYSYELLFVDDCIYHDAENALYEMDKYLPIRKV